MTDPVEEALERAKRALEILDRKPKMKYSILEGGQKVWIVPLTDEDIEKIELVWRLYDMVYCLDAKYVTLIIDDIKIYDNLAYPHFPDSNYYNIIKYEESLELKEYGYICPPELRWARKCGRCKDLYLDKEIVEVDDWLQKRWETSLRNYEELYKMIGEEKEKESKPEEA